MVTAAVRMLWKAVPASFCIPTKSSSSLAMRVNSQSAAVATDLLRFSATAMETQRGWFPPTLAPLQVSNPKHCRTLIWGLLGL